MVVFKYRAGQQYNVETCPRPYTWYNAGLVLSAHGVVGHVVDVPVVLVPRLEETDHTAMRKWEMKGGDIVREGNTHGNAAEKNREKLF